MNKMRLLEEDLNARVLIRRKPSTRWISIHIFFLFLSLVVDSCKNQFVPVFSLSTDLHFNVRRTNRRCFRGEEGNFPL